MSPTPQPQPLIWINAFPGTGKLTIATILQASHDESITLIHNHMLIDPVEAHFPREHPNYQEERKRYRQRILEEVVCNKENLGRGVVFTDYQSTNPLGRSVAREYQTAALRANRPFKPVYLTCSIDSNIQRLASRARSLASRAPSLDNNNKSFGSFGPPPPLTGKLTDVELLREFRARCELFRFEDCEGLEVDTTDLQPQEVAGRIWGFGFGGRGGGEGGEWEGGATSRLRVEGEVERRI